MDKLHSKLITERPASLIMSYNDEEPLYLDAFIMEFESELIRDFVDEDK